MLLLVDHYTVGTELQAMHDRLLAEMPAGAAHEPETCPMCAMDLDPTTGGDKPMSDKTFTQAEMDAATTATEQAQADATASAQRETELAAELAAARDKLNESEVGQAVAAAVADKDATIADLQSKLDQAEAEKVAAEKAFTDFKAEAEATEQATADFSAYLDRAHAREAALKVSELFSEEHISENLERFTAMDDADFEAQIAVIKAAVDAAKGGDFIPKVTSMRASKDADTTTHATQKSALSLLGDNRSAFRTL